MPESAEVEVTVSEFVALFNQTLEYAYPSITIIGELANFRVSKNRWVYFDLKDEDASIKFFGVVYQLPGPLEEGMMLKVRGQPRLHNLYGFSVNILSVQPAGEGSIRKAADLLKAKLQKEGLFDETRKRQLPYPPSRIGLITSKQSAAYADFVKVLGARWSGVEIKMIDVQVQGEVASGQIVAALEQFNALADPPEVLVLIRGGGSQEDLATFSTEQVTRAVAASRVPTLVAIGHENDVALAELVADRHASTPSNAAELLVPDRRHALQEINDSSRLLGQLAERGLRGHRVNLDQRREELMQSVQNIIKHSKDELANIQQLLEVLNPNAVLRRGYAIVRRDNMAIRSNKKIKPGDIVETQLADGRFESEITKILPEKS